MKKKIAYATLTAVIGMTAFFVGKNFTEQPMQPKLETIQLNQIKGWETWGTAEEVGLEIQTEAGTWEITKTPYTAHGVEIEWTEWGGGYDK